LIRFLKITFDGWREVYKNPDFYAQIIVEKYYSPERYINNSKSLTLKQQTLELKLRQKYFLEGTTMKHIGEMLHYKWQKSLEIAKSNGAVPKNTTLTSNDLFTNELIRKAEKIK
jgi:hypothetical protein